MFKNNLICTFILMTFVAGLVDCECPPYKSHQTAFQRCSAQNGTFSVVKTRNGPVGGECVTSLGREICSWKGIPYAAPPINDLRFMPPAPVRPWNKTLWALDFGNRCMETFKKTTGSEDCLFLNVYTPKKKCTASKPCPVMIWVYGGGFFVGSGNSDMYGPEFFIDEEVIIVTFNYRLGPFGFLSTEDGNIPGNAGLLDQQKVFKWVRNNIKAFGGNKNLVTIFGQSAGAASVSYHCLSRASAGLFNRAIMQSGSALSDWAFEHHPRDVVKDLAKRLNIKYTNMADLVAQLKVSDAKELNTAAIGLFITEYNVQQISRFIPHVDYNNPPFISDSPRHIVNQLSAKNQSICHGADVLTGTIINEGAIARYSIFNAPLSYLSMSLNTEKFTPKYCEFEPDSAESKAIGSKIYHNYFTILPLEQNFFQYVTGSHFVAGEYEFNKAVINSGQKPYIYNFKYCGSSNTIRQTAFPFLSCEMTGATHAEDIFTMFTQSKDSVVANKTENDTIVGKQVARSFANFAKTGNPTPYGTQDSLLGVNWEPTTDLNDIRVLNFDTSLYMSKTPHADDIAFWADVCNPNA